MPEFYPPDAVGVGRIVNGLLTIVWDGTPYPRKLRRIGGIVCSAVNSAINVYIGAIAPNCLVATNQYGQQQGYTPYNPMPIPAGAQIYVVFPNATVSDTATATLQTTGITP